MRKLFEDTEDEYYQHKNCKNKILEGRRDLKKKVIVARTLEDRGWVGTRDK